MKKIYFLCILVILFFIHLTAKSQPVSLRSDVSVQFIMNIHEKADRVAKDPISGNLFYITSIGEVYEIHNLATTPTHTLVYTAATHGIDFLQGMAFIDSSLFLVGNHMIDTNGNIGLIKKAVLQPSGSRTWFNVATTDIYPQSNTWYDHGFSGIAVSPDSSYLFISSGSRTDHGEEQNNYGLNPGMREVPLTSAIFRIPSNSVNLILHDDAISLAPYLYADGTRNSFDLAFDAHDNLFGTENSGDRDDPDEVNWIRQGKNYGFPWIMGGDNNPQQYSGYVVASDAMLNHHCNAYLKGYYHNDPGFPSSAGITFAPSVRNLGPDADKFREVSGAVNDGSSSGSFLRSFTPHRSPLGLSFDRRSVLNADLKGDGFMVSYTNGGDSSGLDINGYPGTILDPGQDLLHIKLSPDGSDNYKMEATAIVNHFNNPVDTYLDGNILYVLEYSLSGDGRLYKVALPLDTTTATNIQEKNKKLFSSSIYPNPSSNGVFNINMKNKTSDAKICVYDILGNCVLKKAYTDDFDPSFDLRTQPKGVYFAEIISGNERTVKKIVLQ